MNELNLDRNALVIYLKNLCIAETVIHQTQRKRKQLSSAWLGQEQELRSAQARVKQFEDGSPKEAAFDMANAAVGLAGIVLGATFFLAVVGCIIGAAYGFFADDFEVIRDGVKGFQIGGAIGLTVPLIVGLINMRSANINAQQQTQRNQQKWQQDFAEARQQCESLEAEYNRKSPLVQQEISALDAAIFRMENIRARMYSMNIIPYTAGSSADLRTLAGVQYLYEFLSNSRESFTTAIYNFKLDEIISRLDTLIENTELIMENQREMMRQQDETLRAIRQQEKTMQQAQETLENIRDYDEMIAYNSELQTALAEDALSYQRMRLYAEL